MLGVSVCHRRGQVRVSVLESFARHVGGPGEDMHHLIRQEDDEEDRLKNESILVHESRLTESRWGEYIWVTHATCD